MSALVFKPDIARQLFDNLDQIHLVYIHPNGIGVRGHDFGTDAAKAIEGANAANANGYNIYWTVNHVRPGCNTKPSKADIRSARFVHVDIDPPKSGGAFNKGEITAALLEIDQPPSFVIDSGGGLQAFWRLDGPCANLASIEAINIQARDWFDADACQNIDRLMRVPGSVNWPDKKKIARGRTAKLATWASDDDSVCYAPEELAAGFPPANAPTASSAPVNINVPSDIEMVTPDDLGLSSLDPIRLAIETPPGYDRSGDGLAAARLMANAGHSDAAIMGTLLNPANTVSGHFLAQRDPRRAAARAIQLVRQDSPGEGETLHAPVMSDEQWNAFVANCKAKVRRGLDIERIEEEPLASSTAKHGKDPKWLTDLGDNGIATFVRHVTGTTLFAQPYVTLGAAIAMFGAIAGRRYAGPTGLRPNIYSIGICDSGGGKDHPLRSVTRLMIDAGCNNRVGGSDIASGQAMITDLTKSPNMIYPLDEIGFMFSSVADRKRSPKYATDIMDNLTKFHSLASNTYLGTSYADQSEKSGKPRQVIEQPCLCLFGVTTPGVFWNSLTSGNVQDGSLARIVIFESERNYPDANHDASQLPMPDNLIELVKAINVGADNHNAFPLGDGATITPKPYVVPYADAEAAMVGRQMIDHRTEKLRENEGTKNTGIIARIAENAFKIALIRAIVQNPASPAISTADLEWGMVISSTSVHAIMRAVKEKVADNQYEADAKYVHQAIANAGSAGIDRSRLGNETGKIDKRRRREIVDDLAERGLVRIVELDRKPGVTTGPKPIVYFDIS